MSSHVLTVKEMSLYNYTVWKKVYAMKSDISKQDIDNYKRPPIRCHLVLALPFHWSVYQQGFDIIEK